MIIIIFMIVIISNISQGIGMGADDERVATPSAWQGSNILGWALMEACPARRDRPPRGASAVRGAKRIHANYHDFKVISFDSNIFNIYTMILNSLFFCNN